MLENTKEKKLPNGRCRRRRRRRMRPCCMPEIFGPSGLVQVLKKYEAKVMMRQVGFVGVSDNHEDEVDDDDNDDDR